MLHIKRRDFIGVGGSAALLLAAKVRRARAQQPPKMPRLGVLLYSTPQADPQVDRIRGGLRGLGYIEGQNLVVSYQYAEGKPERLADLASALIREKPDLSWW
jgi:putative ABC transport system substrate-binding protein